MKNIITGWKNSRRSDNEIIKPLKGKTIVLFFPEGSSAIKSAESRISIDISEYMRYILRIISEDKIYENIID